MAIFSRKLFVVLWLVVSNLALADEARRVIDHGAVQIFIESQRTEQNGPGKILVTSGGDYNGDSIADKLVMYTYEHGPNRGDKVFGMYAVAFISEAGSFHKTTDVLFVPESEMIPERILEHSSNGNKTVITAEKRLPSDAMCCPSAIVSLTFSVEESKVVILTGEFQRKSSRD